MTTSLYIYFIFTIHVTIISGKAVINLFPTHFPLRLISLDNTLHLFPHGASVVMRQGKLQTLYRISVCTSEFVDYPRYRGKWDNHFPGWLLHMQNLLSERHENTYTNRHTLKRLQIVQLVSVF